jgi:anti-anti-sigma factor
MAARSPKGGGRKTKETSAPGNEPEPARSVVIEVERSGDWMPAEELREAASAALPGSNDLTLNLERIDHLDASALQILLALELEQKNRGQQLHLVNASPELRRWFELSGAADHFVAHQRDLHE